MHLSFKMLHAARDDSIDHEAGRKPFARLPEQELMLAVLEDAVACYMNHLKPKSMSGKTLFDEAERWFFDAQEDWIFSFVNVCRTMGFDPEYLRLGLRRANKKASPRVVAAKTHRLNTRRPVRAFAASRCQ